VGSLHDRDPRATINRQQRQLRGQRAHLADPDPTASAFWRKSMKVGMIAAVDLTAGPTGPARSVARVLGAAQEAGRKIEREGRLPD
jgi:hypothetical protein